MRCKESSNIRSEHWSACVKARFPIRAPRLRNRQAGLGKEKRGRFCRRLSMGAFLAKRSRHSGDNSQEFGLRRARRSSKSLCEQWKLTELRVRGIDLYEAPHRWKNCQAPAVGDSSIRRSALMHSGLCPVHRSFFAMSGRSRRRPKSPMDRPLPISNASVPLLERLPAIAGLSRANHGQWGDSPKNGPPGLKPKSFAGTFGTAEAVPFQSKILRP